MAQPARLTSGLLARKGQALPTGGFAHAKLDLVPLQPSVAKPEQHRCGTSLPREALLPDLQPTRARAEPAPRARPGRSGGVDAAARSRPLHPPQDSGGAARPLRPGAAAPRARRLSGGVRRGLRVPAQQHPARRELSPRRPGPQRKARPARTLGARGHDQDCRAGAAHGQRLQRRSRGPSHAKQARFASSVRIAALTWQRSVGRSLPAPARPGEQSQPGITGTPPNGGGDARVSGFHLALPPPCAAAGSSCVTGFGWVTRWGRATRWHRISPITAGSQMIASRNPGPFSGPCERAREPADAAGRRPRAGKRP